MSKVIVGVITSIPIARAARYGDEALDGASALIRNGDRGVDAATNVAKYNADFALRQVIGGGNTRASDLVDFAISQGWKDVTSAAGPLKFVDENAIIRLTLKRGSPRAPGSAFPHVEIRNAAGYRTDAFGNIVTRRSPGNHTPITWDLGR